MEASTKEITAEAQRRRVSLLLAILARQATAETQRRRVGTLTADAMCIYLIKSALSFGVAVSQRLEFCNAKLRYQLVQHSCIHLAVGGDLSSRLIRDLLDLMPRMTLDPVPFDLVL